MYRKLAAVGNQELEGYSYRQATERTPIYSSGKGTLSWTCHVKRNKAPQTSLNQKVFVSFEKEVTC